MGRPTDRRGRLHLEAIEKGSAEVPSGKPRSRRLTKVFGSISEMLGESIRLRIGNLSRAVLITGQAYQDPKDALNEFVSNAADEYAEAGIRGGRIRVVLHRRGRYPVVAVEDDGRGMDAERLREVARSLFESSKQGDPRTIGEKAIGMLAFQQLGGRCEIVTRTRQSSETLSLRLERGRATARLGPADRRRARSVPGTTAYISDLDPDALRVLTQRKVVAYLRRRRAAALARGDYTIEVVERRRAELVTPEAPDGVRVEIPPQPTLWGRIEFALFVAPRPDRRRRVAVVGAGGTTIIDDLSELEELDGSPWSTDHVGGMVVFESLKQTAGRRAILRDREAFPVFLDAVRGAEPAVARTLERVAREVDVEVADRLAGAVRSIFRRVLRELADLDNPMRTPLGSEPGVGGLFPGEGEGTGPPTGVPAGDEREGEEGPSVEELVAPRPGSPPPARPGSGTGRPEGSRASRLPSLAPDPNPDGSRSRFDPEDGIVYYNDTHPDYLLVKNEEAGLLDYLATLVAKEYVVFNNPRAAPGELAEEMVRMVVRVRRHMPRKP